MMRWLISTALRLRVLVIALSAVILVWGFRLARDTPVDVFPEFATPRVEIQTEAPGLSPEEVESLVTMPLEYAFNGTPWLQTIRSKSVLGLSSILLLFEVGTDLNEARQLAQERLALAAPGLPGVALPPVILQPLSSTSRALKVGMWSQSLSQMELSELAKWTIRPRLMAIEGVANVAIWGQRDRQFQVLVDPDRLRAHGLTLDAVERASRAAAALGTGGFVDTANQRLPVRQRSPIRSADDLARAVVTFRQGAALTLGDVAEVVLGHPPPIGDAVINDRPGILLIVEKQPWGNTLDVTLQVETALEALKPALTGVELDSTIFRPATFIEQSLANLSRALLVGCVLVVILLVLFLWDWRTAVISTIAIPLSILCAGIILHFVGATVNTMILAGLVIAVGEVVDDAIIGVENIARRLKLNYSLIEPKSEFHVALEASLEVRSAVVVASLIVVLVFLPIFFLEGLTGSFFRPLAFAYVLAILASLLVALVVTPALSLMLLARRRAENPESPVVALIKRVYRRVLPFFVSRPGAIIGTLVVAFTLTGVSISFLGEEFLPKFQERDFLMHWLEKPGTSLEAMRRITIRVSRELRDIEGVRNFGAHIGRAEVADEVVGPDFTELWISIDKPADYTETVKRIQEVVDGYPGLYRDVLTYLKERIKEVLTGTSATIVVRIFGPDLEVLRQEAQAVKKAIDGADGRGPVAGVIDLKVESQTLVPQIEVRLRPGEAAAHGVTAADVRGAVTTLVKGSKVGEVYEEQKIYDVAVWGVPELRTDLASLRRILVDTPAGGQIALGDIAEVVIVRTPNAIKREGASRRIDVTCNVRDRDLGSVAREVEERVRALDFDRGYYPEILGEYAERKASRDRLLSLAFLALLGILVVLYVDFQSLRLTLLVALTIPFALIGGVVGALVGGGVLSLGSLIGFVTVLGIAARNGILLISHYRHLQREENEEFSLELILRGAEERLSPILMTALTAALALLPLAISGNLPGHEIEFPMALVILGGLVTSTVLNLFFMPALYARFQGEERIEKDLPRSGRGLSR